MHCHSLFTELHFFRHIRLGHEGIGKHNPSAHLQTLGCEYICCHISYLFILFYLSLLLSSHDCLEQKQKNRFTNQGTRVTRNCIVTAVSVIKATKILENDKKRVVFRVFHANMKIYQQYI